MKNETAPILAELDKITADFKDAFGEMSDGQLNWKPSSEGWSIAQCVDHLIKSNAEVQPVIDAKISGAKNSAWETVSPLSGFFGRLLKKSLASDARKFKAPSQGIVPPSEIGSGIIERFAADQLKVKQNIEAMEDLDWDKTKITSPFMRLVTYRLRDGLTIVVEHEKRHFRQAIRVTETAGFPNL